MKLCWLSVNPIMQSSFSVVSDELLRRLNPRGEYEIAYLAQFWYGQPEDKGAYIVTSFQSGDHLLYYLRELKPDIFLIYQSPTFLSKFSEWQAQKIKDVAKLVLYVPIEGYPITEYIPLMDVADLILVPSEFSQKCLKQEGYSSEVLYHGVDTKVFHPPENWQRKFNHPNPFCFGTIASHVPRKQLTRIMDAHSLTLRSGYESRLMMSVTTYDSVPWMPNLKRYKARINSPAQLSETAYLNLPMSKQAIAKLYHAMHVHVLPSSEAFGLPNLEALASGVVPILIRHGGAPEIVKDCGLYADIEAYLTTSMGNFALVSRKSLAETMIWAMENPSALEKIAEKGSKRAKKFTWIKPANKLRKLLEGLA